MSILGNRVLRKEDPKFLTTGGEYLDDLDLPGVVYLTYLRSTMAHARIAAIDTAEAKKAPGVVAIFTAADVDLAPAPPTVGMLNQQMLRPFLADGVVRYVGEPVAAIVTEEKYQGPDAAELIFIDYDPLPAVVTMEAASAGDTLLFPDVGTNVAFELNFGRDEGLFEGCDVVVTERLHNQRIAPCPLEVRATAARQDGDRLTVWTSTQTPHGARDGIAGVLGMAPEAVHLIAPDVGGGFGAKIGTYPEDILIAYFATKLGRPVKWVETRSESMVSLGHGRAQIQDIEIGGSRDGTIQAYRISVTQDAGAYPMIGALLPFLTRMMAPGVYNIPKVEFFSRSFVSNTTPKVAYRGAGRPEATAAIERAIDIFANEIGMDPADVRRKNLLAKDGFPHTTVVGTTYDSGDYQRALDLVLDASDYKKLRADQKKRRDAGDRKQLGIGMSVYVEVTNGAGATGEYGGVEVHPDGKAVVRTGSSPHGQGHVTAWAMLASEQLGIPIEDIEVLHGDTDLVRSGEGTMGSRSLQSAGLAVHQAAEAVVDKARQLAAELLEANPDDVVLDKLDGKFHVAGTPAASKSWGELAGTTGEDRGIYVDLNSAPPSATFPFGAHVAVVEIDTETGQVVLQRLVAVDDAGRIVNPLLAEGQRHGGLAQGAAQALLEEVRYDDDGNPVTSNLADYAFPSAAELPSFELVAMETPTPVNALGVKGIGESGTIGSTPAVQNAVVDGLSHLGIRHVDMPASPERVWRAINSATT
jgi:aerobic carbon-monoxide dehydrogenase large subunit